VITFSDDRRPHSRPSARLATDEGGVNVSPNVEEEVPDMKVNYFGLRVNKGVTVATFVTTASLTGASRSLPPLGALHSRSRLAVNESPRCGRRALYGPSRPQHRDYSSKSRRHIGRTGPYGHVLAHGVAV